MGTWGELFDLESNGDHDASKNLFYDTVHFPFGLPSRSVRAGQKFRNPIRTKIRSNKIQSFEVEGNQLAVSMFLVKGWSNVFSRIRREIPLRAGHGFVFNISGLHEGKLSGYQAVENSPELELSNERIEILDLVGVTMPIHHLAPPLVYVEMGETWANYGIPDRVFAQFFTMSPVQDYAVKSFTRAVYHRYQILAKEQELDISCTFDKSSSVFNLSASRKRQEPVNPHIPAQPTAPPKMSTPAREDSFPYEYFQGIGLIDDEGMVLIDTILGPMRIPADSESGRLHLLEAGKKL